MAKDKLTRHNGIIRQIGARYIGHYGVTSVHVVFENSGGTCSFDITCNSKFIKEFINLFDHDGIDIENGFYIEELKGKYICGWFDNNEHIVGLSAILDDNGHNILMLE